MSLKPVLIAGYDSGLETNKKPFLLIDSAFQELTNAFVWRERVKKREGIKLLGRLRRVLTNEDNDIDNVAMSYTPPGTGVQTIAIFTVYGVNALEPNADLEKGSAATNLVVTLDPGGANETILTDSAGTGVMVITGAAPIISLASINYATGVITATFTAAPGALAVRLTIGYFPALPCMGISLRELAAINVEDAIFFDTRYAYTHNGNDFIEMGSTTATTWSGTDSDFFWSSNYRGSVSSSRLFFTTNFSNATSDPIRYHNGATWADLTPVISAAGTGTEDSMFQAKIVIPYYGRLLALNTWEGRTAGSFGGASNFFNRCRFSQVGDPTQADAWYSDVFGKGGFIDAPTNEAIVSARFYKNTLLVYFEKTTWALQYVGDVGLPFVWERISSDFGSESTFSTVLFDSGVLAVGDKAIVGASSNDVQRIDLQIPDAVFNFHNQNGGKKRVQGIRDFQKEIVYWTYSDGGLRRKFPNRVLIYNYRNATWAVFRDNVTAFGQFTSPAGITWDSPESWDEAISWDTIFQGEFPTIVCGNQQGYIHQYQYPVDMESTADSNVNAIENESLSITAITRSATDPLRITVQDHNLENGELIYITGLAFLTLADNTVLATTLNDSFYQVQRVDDDNLDLFYYDRATNAYLEASGNNLGFTPATGTGTYIGCGEVTLFPKLQIRTKDFNPFQNQGKQLMLSYIDFQTDATANAAVSVELVVNSSSEVKGNMIVGSDESETALVETGLLTGATQADPAQITSTNHGLKTGDTIFIKNVVGMTELNNNTYTVTFVDLNNFTLDGTDSTAFTAYDSGGNWVKNTEQFYYVPGQNYAWHRFYATSHGQYISLFLTYDEQLMNIIDTHQQKFEMNAMQLWTRPAGRVV